MFVWSYNNHSRSLTQLRENGLPFKKIKKNNSRFKGTGKFIINWGNSNYTDEIDKADIVLNEPDDVKNVVNKKTFFEMMQESGVTCPHFTTNVDDAYQMLREGSVVVGREKLTGHSGDGIVIFENEDQWDDHNHNDIKLYVRYIPKKHEYRVHLFNRGLHLDEYDVQRKAARHDFENPNWRVRNHKNGFVFVRNDAHKVPDIVIAEAHLALAVSNLDFGAVDVVYNEKRNRAYVLEINTAPGLEGTTADFYMKNFMQLYDEYYGNF